MQKRTRIITVATLLTGALLGLAMLLATLSPVGAASQGHRHNNNNNNKGGKKIVVVKKGVTTTITTTINNTVTVAPPGPPPPFCFITPNPVFVAVGSPYGPNPSTASAPGDAQFELECRNLGTSTSYKIIAVFPCTGNFNATGIGGNIAPIVNSTVVTSPSGFHKNESVIPDIFPDLNGNLQITYVLEGCQTGSGAVTVISASDGSAVSVPTSLVTH